MVSVDLRLSATYFRMLGDGVMKKANHLLPFAAIVITAIYSTSLKAEPISATLIVDQLPQPGGGVTYRLTSFRSNETLTGPTGTTLQSPFTPIDFSSFSDLGNVLFGDWTVVYQPLFGSVETGVFHINPFSLTDVATATPTILSPLSGSTVPPDFLVTWIPNGTAQFQNVTFNLTNLATYVTYHFGTVSTVEFITQPNHPGPGSISVQPYLATDLKPIAISGQFSSFLSLEYRSDSLAATYNVVPEPTSAALVAFAAMILVAIAPAGSRLPAGYFMQHLGRYCRGESAESCSATPSRRAIAANRLAEYFDQPSYIVRQLSRGFPKAHSDRVL